MTEDDAALSGYYDVVSIEQSHDCDHGPCLWVEIKSDAGEIIQIGFFGDNILEVDKVSVLKKGYHY